MSRIGKLPITILSDVVINYKMPNLQIQGKFGKLELIIPDSILITKNR